MYGVCTNSWDRVSQYIVPRIGNRPLIALWNQTSITTAYNHILDSVKARDLDMLVLIHDDLEMVDPACEEKLLMAVNEPDVAFVGVAGGSGVRSLAWWDYETVGHQLIDTGMLDFGPHVGDVDSIEGSIMAFSPWSIEHLRFDEEFMGFQCCDEICLAAKRLGKRVVVADILTHHHTKLGFTSQENEAAWLRANDMYKRKYNL